MLRTVYFSLLKPQLFMFLRAQYLWFGWCLWFDSKHSRKALKVQSAPCFCSFCLTTFPYSLQMTKTLFPPGHKGNSRDTTCKPHTDFHMQWKPTDASYSKIQLTRTLTMLYRIFIKFSTWRSPAYISKRALQTPHAFKTHLLHTGKRSRQREKTRGREPGGRGHCLHRCGEAVGNRLPPQLAHHLPPFKGSLDTCYKEPSQPPSDAEDSGRSA